MSPELPSKVVIYGVGLLGGSIGLRLRQINPTCDVVGVTRTEASGRAALAAGCVTSTTRDGMEVCVDADAVFVCTPVSMVASQIVRIAAHVPSHAFITDVGSTKVEIVREVMADQTASRYFVGSHPIAGSELSGAANARSNLFTDKLVVVTPTPQTDPCRLSKAEELWRAIGARVQRMSAAEHDDAMAGISHAPHFAACAVALSISATERPLVGSGFRDTTRVAAGDPRMWLDIAMQNQSSIAGRLREIRQNLESLLRSIETNDQDELLRQLIAAQQARQQIDTLSGSPVIGASHRRDGTTGHQQ